MFAVRVTKKNGRKPYVQVHAYEFGLELMLYSAQRQATLYKDKADAEALERVFRATTDYASTEVVTL